MSIQKLQAWNIHLHYDIILVYLGIKIQYFLFDDESKRNFTINLGTWIINLIIEYKKCDNKYKRINHKS